mgnify:CR=1 FL=1
MKHTGPATLALCASLLLLAGCATAPQPTPTHELGDPDTSAYLESNAKALAESYGISNPPTVSPVRLITLDEWAPTQITCLSEEGYDASFTPDGQGIQYPKFTEPALTDALNLAIYTCEVRYPVSPRYMQPLSHAQLERLYDYRSGELVKCLANEGVEISSPPPSKEVFVESNGDWSPYAEFTPTDEQIRDLPKQCPQTPADLWG